MVLGNLAAMATKKGAFTDNACFNVLAVPLPEGSSAGGSEATLQGSSAGQHRLLTLSGEAWHGACVDLGWTGAQKPPLF